MGLPTTLAKKHVEPPQMQQALLVRHRSYVLQHTTPLLLGVALVHCGPL